MMKIRCSVCEAAEARVLCCADEAALCWGCDHRVHAANKLAGKHQRVPLYGSASRMPKCDICQETVGYFFCLEDRALLCRKCDVAIHTVNSLVSVHQRFLLTGVKVGLEATEAFFSLSSGKAHADEKISKSSNLELNRLPKEPSPSNAQHCKTKTSPVQSSRDGDFALPKLAFAGGSCTGTISTWQVDEFIGLGDFSHDFDFMSNGLSKADIPEKVGDSVCSQMLGGSERELEGEECMGGVADTFWAVPQISSPPTASGLYWPKNDQNPSDYVPEISSSDSHIHDQLLHGAKSKRRRCF